MRCDKCGRPTETLYNKMPLCPSCKESVKKFRSERSAAAPAKISAKGK